MGSRRWRSGCLPRDRPTPRPCGGREPRSPQGPRAAARGLAGGAIGASHRDPRRLLRERRRRGALHVPARPRPPAFRRAADRGAPPRGRALAPADRSRHRVRGGAGSPRGPDSPSRAPRQPVGGARQRPGRAPRRVVPARPRRARGCLGPLRAGNLGQHPLGPGRQGFGHGSGVAHPQRLQAAAQAARDARRRARVRSTRDRGRVTIGGRAPRRPADAAARRRKRRRSRGLRRGPERSGQPASAPRHPRGRRRGVLRGPAAAAQGNPRADGGGAAGDEPGGEPSPRDPRGQPGPRRTRRPRRARSSRPHRGASPTGSTSPDGCPPWSAPSSASTSS